jgi:hypothetical protein
MGGAYEERAGMAAVSREGIESGGFDADMKKAL